MKKLFLTLFIVALFCSLFCGSTYASTVDKVGDAQGTEIVEETDTNTEPSTVEDNASELVQNAIDIITNSTFISTLATVLTGISAIVIFFVRGINSIKSLIHSKADAQTVTETVNQGVKDIADNFSLTVKELNAKLETVEKALESEKDNSKQLAVILSTFILHTKIGTSAKAEILKYINGLKDYTGSATEIIEELEEAIEQAEKEEEKIETPALDKVCAISLE